MLRTIRETAGLLGRILNKRERLTETEAIAFAEMRQSVRCGRRLTERQQVWAERVARRVGAARQGGAV